MCRWLRVLLVALALTAVWMLPGQGLAQIAGSDHDFSPTGGGEWAAFSTTDPGAPPNQPFINSCNGCHVAHHAGSDILLWAHTLSSETITFGSKTSTLAGTNLSTVTITSASEGPTKLCLSCHDGTVAVGNRTLLVGTTPENSNWATQSGETVITGDHVIPTGTSGSLSLARTHPVRIPYAGQTYNSVTSMADVTAFQGFTPAAGNVSSIGEAKVYKDSGGGWGLECPSCHSVHNTNAHGPLLRGPGGTDICTQCHIK